MTSRTLQQGGAGKSYGRVWVALARVMNAPETGSDGIWRGLDQRLGTGGMPAATGMWSALERRVDPAQFCPQAVPEVAEEVVVEDDQQLTVIRSPHGNYLRLTDLQRDLWQP